MKLVNEVVDKKKKFPTKVIQFGEGNFLRAFIDWQIQKMNEQEIFEGGVAIVQPLANGMVKMLSEQENYYTVLLEGLLNGKKIQSTEIITCINETIDPYEDYRSYLALADNKDIEIIVSNTTEAGIAFDENDVFSEEKIPNTFPAKLTILLYRRFKNKLKGFHIIPCELINHGGKVLKETIFKYVDLWKLDEEFKLWLENENYFYSTLVDRIVPGYPKDSAEEIFEKIGYRDNLLVKAEPFLLFVIEGDEKLLEVFQLTKAGLNVLLVKDMQPYRERKVRLLNAPHTALALTGLIAGIETVGEAMKDEDFSKFINDLMYKEISPKIDLDKKELADYSESIKERFNNPFVKHALSSISLNSVSKFKARLLPTLNSYLQEDKLVKRIVLALSALITIYGNDTKITPFDTQDILNKFEKLKLEKDYIKAVLACTDFWGVDLSSYQLLVASVIENVESIKNGNIRKLIQELNKEEICF